MPLSIREKADIVATFRFIAVHLMETLARWVPTTPELEVKVLFGRHLWDFAQHADALGKRTAELRLGMHHSRRPIASYMDFLDALAVVQETVRRLDGLFTVALPDLEARYRRYLEATDALMDEPTVRIIERILADFVRMCRDRDDLAKERPDLGAADRPWLDQLAHRGRAVADCVDYRPVPRTAEAV